MATRWPFCHRSRAADVIKGVQITEDDFSVAAVSTEMRATHGAAIGALVTFTGLVRERNSLAADGSSVSTLTLEHYPGMTQASIEKILDKAEARWPLLEAQVIHRIGTLVPADQIVLVAVASGHRDAAFAAAEFIMDYLKTDAVFWKKEQTRNQSHWLASTADDVSRAQKWRSVNRRREDKRLS